MTTMTRPARLATTYPDEARRREHQAYALACPCGQLGGTVTGTASAALALRAHRCSAHLAGPVAEPVGRSR